jgi:hypothetical protein
MAARSAAGGRASAEGPSLSRPQKPSSALPNQAFIASLLGQILVAQLTVTCVNVGFIADVVE